MNAQDRRVRLRPRPAPAGLPDYVSVLEGSVTRTDRNGGIDVTIRYVPDRSLLRPEMLGAYLEALGDGTWESLEAIGAAVLADVNDALVPRWIEVRVATANHATGIESHAVLLQDRQPKWDNPALLARLRKY